MRRRDDRDELRERIDLDEQAGGFQIRSALPGGPTDEQIALADQLIDFVTSLSVEEILWLDGLKKNKYKLRPTARALGVDHKLLALTLKKLPGWERLAPARRRRKG